MTSTSHAVQNFVVATITPIALQNIGYGTYLLFMAFMILGTLWAFFLLPELKNKTLEEVSRKSDLLTVKRL